MTSKDFDPVIDELVITTRKEIVFIEDNVADIDTLIRGIGSGKEIVILDSTRDGLHQIAEVLAGRTGIDALHVIAHGREGAADFGALQLNGINTGAHGADLQAIGSSMAPDGDILLYGCNIGAGENGAGFLQQLAIATGADVAASNDLTGSATLGGNWELEVASGSIETPVVVNAQTAALYQQVLLGISNAPINFNTPGNFIATSFDTSQATTNAIYMVNGDPAYQLVIDGEDLGTSAYFDGTSANSYVSVAANGADDAVTIRFAAGQIFTATSISIANFLNPDWGYPGTQSFVIKGYDAAGHQIGATATQPVTYTPNTVTKVPITLTGMVGISSLKITATTNGNKLHYLVIDDLSLSNIQPPPPKVIQVSSIAANGTYKIGSTIDIVLNFDGAVTVTGTPQLTLETGTTDRVINYLSGSGSSSLTFRYTVQAGDTSTDLDLASSVIALNGGTIKAYGNASLDASLTLPSPGGLGSLLANKDIVVDGIVPTMSISSDKTVLKVGETANITFTFSEDPGASFTWNGSSGDVVVTGGTLSAISGSGLTRTAVFTPSTNTNGGSASISVNAGAYADAAGNINTAGSNGPAITYDTKAPTVSVSSSQPVLKVGETATITFTFSEDPGASFDASDITFSGGTLGAISGSGLTRTAVFTPTANTNNGSATITVKNASFQDPAGNSNASVGSTSLTYDTKAPTLTIGSDKPALKAGETATITFTFSEDPGASFDDSDIAVSGGTLSALSGSGTTRTAVFTPAANVDAGTASISVAGTRYEDAKGNTGANASLAFGYDTLAPNKPSAPVLDAGDDSGSSNSDVVTNKSTLHLSGSADSGSTVMLYDGGDVIASVTASGGTYSFTLADVAEGNHAYAALAVDAAGNVSAVSDGQIVVVDRTPPSTTAASAALSADTGASATDMITKEALQTISGTLSANLASGEQVMVSLDNGASWSPAAAGEGTNTWELAGVTLSGSNTLKVQVVDLAGNAGPVYAHAYTLDTVAPAAPSTPDLDAGSDSGSSSTDNITSVARPSFSGTAEIGSTVRLYDGATEIGHVTVADGTWQITSDIPLADGSHSITAKATDLAGNVSDASAALTIQILTAGPSTTVQSMALSNDNGVDGDFITNQGSQTISGTLSGLLATGERVQVSLDGGHAWLDATSAAGSNAWSIAATLSEGSHDIQVRVVDAVDNAGPVHTQAYTLDTAPPSLTITSSPSTLKAGETATITFSFSEDPGSSFSWDGEHGSVNVSGGTLSAIQGSGTTRTATFTPAADTNAGTASITVAAGQYHDAAGNAGTAGATPSLSFDTLAPSAPSTPDLDAGSDKGASSSDNLTSATSLVFKGTAEAGATVRLYGNDGVTEIGHATATGGAWTITTSALAEGSNNITARAFDAAGNASAFSAPVAVTVDTTRPTLAITSDKPLLKIGETATITFTFSEDPGSSFSWDGSAGSVTVTGGTLSAIVGTGTERTAVFTPSAGTNGGIAGISVVAGAYQDAAGNDGHAAATPSLHFDTLAPAAPSMPDLDAGSDSGSSDTDDITSVTLPGFSGTAEVGATVRLFDGGIEIGSDVVGADGKWHIVTDSATPFGQRTHYVTAIATDAAGNSSTNSPALAVQVITSGPATTIAGMTLSNDSGVAGDFITKEGSQTISGTLSANLATGERVQVSLDGGHAWLDATGVSGSNAWSIAATLSEGSHDIQVRVIDAVDNTGPVHTQAYTLDTAPPSLTITSSASTLKAGETATITFTFSEDPGSSFSWDGSAGSVSVSGGTLSAVIGTGATRTATFTPTADTNTGTGSITVGAGQYHDAAGNLGTAGITPSISYDTLAPNAPGAPALADGDDSGASSSDHLTNRNPLTFTGSAEDGTTVRLYDGGTEIGHVTASGGKYSIPVNNLGEGAHSLTAIAFDAAGNASAASGALAVAVDRTPPTTMAVDATLSNDTGASSTDMVTSQESQTISGTLSAGLAAGEQVMVSLDNGASWSPATASVGSNTWSLPVTLSGSGTLKVQVVDLAGNTGPAYSHAYTLDKVAPGAPSTPDLDAGSDSGSSSTDNITGVTKPTFSGTAEIGSTVRLYDGATEIGHVTVTDGTWQITSDIPLAGGSHSITAKATDLAGNVSDASAALTVQILTAGPSTTVQSMALSNDTGAGGDFITKDNSQTISGTLSANLATGERVQVSLDGGHVWNDAAGAAGSNAWSIAATLSEGSHDIQVRVIDALDNTGPVHAQAYTLDSVSPTVSITSSASQLKIGETATITFTFSEDPGSSFGWDGSAGDLTVSGGTLSALQGSGLVRTAIFTPDAQANGGNASIGVKASSYEDAAGNFGSAATAPSLSFDTLAPGAPSAPDLDKGSDKGASDSDNLTSATSLVFKGTAEAGATVTLYDSDGTTVIGSGTATGGNWTITTSVLGEGSHKVTASAIDAAGNVSAVSDATTVTVDTTRPTLAITSSASQLKIGETATITFTFSEDPGSSFGWDGSSGSLTVSGGTLSALQGTGLVRTATFTPAANTEAGTAGIAVSNGAYQDAAGNDGAAAVAPSLHFDTLAPAAPAAPVLQAASDTGAKGDGITQTSMPVIEGTALANTVVTLYETIGTNRVKVGTAMADAGGKWSIATGLASGVHALSATQTDAAGNESAASAAFTLRIIEPPVPVKLIDGMPVTIQPISLPGGVNGSAVSIPVVGTDRAESSGSASVADIPLATSGQGGTLLLAQVAPGYGLSASGASLPAAGAGELLIAAIKAATPTHAASDQGHLTANGQSFLAGLASAGSLLVETVKPVSTSAPDGMLTLSGPASGAGQSTALVIDAGGLAAGSTIALQQVNFAAVIGTANVVAQSSMVLTGDAASQHFTVAPGGSGSVFAGGGKDVLGVAATGQGSSPAAGVTLLHGGSDSDIASFSGARADYDIAFHNGYAIVSSKAAPGVKAMVVNVEQLQFSDASVAVQNSADMGLLAGMYQTVLGRQADVMGIEYWANVHQAGASWGAIALGMIASNEHASGHEGFNGMAAHDIALLYTAIFNRDADAGGLAYWSAAMARGATLEQVASSFVQSVEMVGHQRVAADWDFIVA